MCFEIDGFVKEIRCLIVSGCLDTVPIKYIVRYKKNQKKISHVEFGRKCSGLVGEMFPTCLQ